MLKSVNAKSLLDEVLEVEHEDDLIYNEIQHGLCHLTLAYPSWRTSSGYPVSTERVNSITIRLGVHGLGLRCDYLGLRPTRLLAYLAVGRGLYPMTLFCLKS